MSRRLIVLAYVLVAAAAYVLFANVLVPAAAKHTPLCGSCHATREAYRSWAESPHSGVSCLQCHNEPGIGGFFTNQIAAVVNAGRTFVASERAPDVKVHNDACLACHDRVLDDTVKGRHVRMSHREVVSGGWRCSDCHGSVGHRLSGARAVLLQASMDKCLRCHRRGGAASWRCGTCHLKAAAGKPANPASSGTLTHTANWDSTHGSGSLRTCGTCHEQRFCRRCHAISIPHPKDWPSQHGDEARTGKGDFCVGCHERGYCDNCHGTVMPHPTPYFPVHNGQTVDTAQTCPRCHEMEQCQGCHTRHEQIRKR